MDSDEINAPNTQRLSPLPTLFDSMPAQFLATRLVTGFTGYNVCLSGSRVWSKGQQRMLRREFRGIQYEGTPTQMHLHMPGGSTAAVAFAPAVSEFLKLATHSDLESTCLVERHEQSMACVPFFMRRNDGRMEVSRIDETIERTMSAIDFPIRPDMWKA